MPINTTFEMTQDHWSALEKSGARHKYSYGHAAIVAGGAGRGGAARLAARGALRIGAGLVSVICPRDAVMENATHLNAIMIKPFGKRISLTSVLAQLQPDAICIGPNLGLDDVAISNVMQALASELPLCIDADAISLMAGEAMQHCTVVSPQSVMTPHEGELRRFIPLAFQQTTCRITLAKTAAAKAQCVVLFKGTETIIATPSGETTVVSSTPYDHAGWLATAGSGDVLAGFVTGLLARGFDGLTASAVAATLHLRCAEAFGPGLIAEDLPDMLPRVMRSS